MADQRQPFRFRLPWLAGAPTAQPPRPSTDSQPPRPRLETQTPARPTATVPVQRPPFRPAGIAPAQPPPSQAQVPQRTEAQPPSTTPAPTQPQVATQPSASQAQVPQTTEPQPPSTTPATPKPQVVTQPAAPPSRPTPQALVETPTPSDVTTESRVTSPPAPISRTAPTTPALASLPRSPSRAEPQPRAAGPVPSSPSRTSQTQPTSRASPQPRPRTTSQASPPSRSSTQAQPTGPTTLQTTIAESSQPTFAPTQAPSLSEQEVPKPVVPQPLSQEPQPMAQVPSETTFISQELTATETSSQPDGEATRPTKVSPASDVIGDEEKHITKRESEEREGGKKAAREIIAEEKTSGPGYEKPTKKTITGPLSEAASVSETREKDITRAGFQAQQEPKQEKEETFDRKETIVATSSREKQIKIASPTHQKERRTSSISTTQRPSPISNGEQLPLHEEVRKDISKFVQKLATGHPTGDKPVSVITLAGENRGASMHLGLDSATREASVHIHRGYKLNPDESTGATTDGEGSSKDKRSEDPTTKENPPSRAFVNSNVQSVNNSILFNSSVTERNPGVQLVVSHTRQEPTKSNGKPDSLESHKAEFNVTPSEKLTYQPTIRRRCLGGLFLEPSDSDPDNPEKPRRHGCRFSRAQKDKEKEIGVL